MSAIDVCAAILRGIHLAALISLLGTLLFLALVLPATNETTPARKTLHRLAWFSATASVIAGFAWLVVESAVIAGAENVAATLRALPVVAGRTQFGHWLLLRLMLLVLSLPLLSRPWSTVTVVSVGIALAIQPLLAHAGAIGGSLGKEVIASEIMHLLAAGAWLGGLLPLFLAVSRLPHEAAAATCRSFTPIGLASVLVLAGTAIVQVATFMGGLPGLFGTEYGHVALVKLGLFVVLLVLAALNRFALTDRLAINPSGRPYIRFSIAAEITLGLLVIMTASFLASSTPGTHEQPVWPLPWRLSGSALSDPGARNEAVGAVIATVCSIVIAMTGFVWRRARWLALSTAAVTLIAAIPYLSPFFVPAYPTSFFSSPTEFAATAIVQGAQLFATNCAICHGAEGHGDGPAASSLAQKPADLTAEHFWAHSDGELYWFITHGFVAVNGATAMPGFAGTLSTEAVWHLIDYLHAHNAGEAMRRTGRWPQPIPLPQLDAQCANGRVVDLDDLRGRPLRIVAVSGDEQAPPLNYVDMVTVLVARNAAPKPTDATCVANEPQAWTALALIAGTPADALAGTQMLADQNGWLRAVWQQGATNFAQLRDILAHPLVAPGISAHHH
jgi:putative copper export protein/mono/diheme cytochrome c family protein